MSQYLYQAALAGRIVPVLILSATLPAKTRVKLIENYMYGAGRKWRDVTGPEGWETTTAYPLITYTDGMAVNQFCDFATTRNTKVTIVCLAEEDLISTLAEQLQDGGIAGIIVNTVRRAQEIARCAVRILENSG